VEELMDIVLLTAGPDSVFALDYALTQTDEPILAVHVYLGTAMAKIERRALARIVPYMQRTRRPFEFMSLTQTWPLGYAPHHNVVTGLAVAAVQMARGDIKLAYRGDSAEEVVDVREGRDGHGIKGDLVFDHITAALLSAPGTDVWARSQDVPTPCLPGNRLSKVDYIAAFEPELRAMLISCRAPQITATGACRPCGSCIKCGYMQQAERRS
jgi:hypothetical protein